MSVDRFFVGEISGDAELNIASWMRLSVSGGWRMVQGVSDLEGVINEDLSGFFASVAIKVGRF